MNTLDIEKIIKIFENASIETLDLEIDNIKIKLKKNTMPSAPSIISNNKQLKNNEDEGYIVKAPLVGTFYASPSVGAEPFVVKGTKVKKGDKLCIIEAMKVMNEILAPTDGIIKEIYLDNEAMVEYDQKLFLIGEEND